MPIIVKIFGSETIYECNTCNFIIVLDFRGEFLISPITLFGIRTGLNF